MTAPALLTSAWQHWTSPDPVLHRVRCVGPIDLDPCGNQNDAVHAAESWWGLEHIFPAGPCVNVEKHARDGLAERWIRPGRGLIYCNPPYGREIGDWTGKARREAEDGAEVIMLLPARTDTGWWHEHVAGFAQARCFWKGRIRFGNPPPGRGTGQSSTFPSAIVYWGANPWAFAAAFHDAGEIVI